MVYGSYNYSYSGFFGMFFVNRLIASIALVFIKILLVFTFLFYRPVCGGAQDVHRPYDIRFLARSRRTGGCVFSPPAR